MENIDGKILELFRQLDARTQSAFLNVFEIMNAGLNGQTACPAARTEKGRELLRLFRESGSPSASLQASMMEVIAEYLDGEGGNRGNGPFEIMEVKSWIREK